MSQSDQNKEARERARKFIWNIFWGVTVLPVVMWLWPSVVPFTYFELWGLKGSLSQWVGAGIPIFLWGLGISVYSSLMYRNNPMANRNAESLFASGLVSSVRAGVVEEITFRWLFLMNMIVGATVVNFLFFGFMGFGIPEMMHLYVFGPIANWTTFGGLEDYLFHTSGWALGAAILSSNAFFRDGHKYQGLFGVINSWFAGMYLFWIAFTFGLIPAIVIHMVYDFIIDTVRYLDRVLERKLGYV